MATRKRFQPLSTELGGTLRVFLYAWAILFIILFLALGCNTWAFYGALPISFILAWPVLFLMLFLTGVKGPIQ